MNETTHRPTLSEQAYRVIKQRIIRLEMAPGAPFTEAYLAEYLGLSKTPVREALSWLQRDGLVNVEARSRYIVAPVTLKDVRDLYALRVLLEGEAVALATSHTLNAADLESLEQLSCATYDPHDHESIARFLSINTRFHARVARFGGNMRLAMALEQVLHQMERLFHLTLAVIVRNEDNARSHGELISVIRQGEPEVARTVASAAARSSEKMVMESLMCSDAVLSANLAEVPAWLRQVSPASVPVAVTRAGPTREEHASPMVTEQPAEDG